jgi:hypothetical protein
VVENVHLLPLCQVTVQLIYRLPVQFSGEFIPDGLVWFESEGGERSSLRDTQITAANYLAIDDAGDNCRLRLRSLFLWLMFQYLFPLLTAQVTEHTHTHTILSLWLTCSICMILLKQGLQ